MDRPIVVPLDGTARAEGALPLALDVAGSVEAPVHLVRVSEPMPAPYAAIGDSREIIGAANLRLRQADNLYLQKVREALEEEQVAGRTVRTELLVGPARETLLAYIREQNAALV